MNYLLEDLGKADQIQGREKRLRVDWGSQKIAYKAPNGTVFFIDTKPLEVGGDIRVISPVIKDYPLSHKTHTNGDGTICLAENLRGWALVNILFFIDSWARGFELYNNTGVFPDSPKACFKKQGV